MNINKLVIGHANCQHKLLLFQHGRKLSLQKHVLYLYLQSNIIPTQINKMRAKLAIINNCAVPFVKPRRRQLVLVLLYNIHTVLRSLFPFRPLSLSSPSLSSLCVFSLKSSAFFQSTHEFYCYMRIHET